MALSDGDGDGEILHRVDIGDWIYSGTTASASRRGVRAFVRLVRKPSVDDHVPEGWMTLSALERGRSRHSDVRRRRSPLRQTKSLPACL